MNTYTDDQLKQALAKMLPDIVEVFTVKDSPEIVLVEAETGTQYRDTELLHLCWMVEETLTNSQTVSYYCALNDLVEITTFPQWAKVHATWQQRVIALCNVKGVDIV